MVTLYAGQQEEAKPFLIHKDFACHYSEVLNIALNSDFVEGQTQSYRLDEDNGEVVRLLNYCKWEFTKGQFYFDKSATLRRSDNWRSYTLKRDKCLRSDRKFICCDLNLTLLLRLLITTTAAILRFQIHFKRMR